MSNGGMRKALDRYTRRVFRWGVAFGISLALAAWALWEVWEVWG